MAYFGSCGQDLRLILEEPVNVSPKTPFRSPNYFRDRYRNQINLEIDIDVSIPVAVMSSMRSELTAAAKMNQSSSQ